MVAQYEVFPAWAGVDPSFDADDDEAIGIPRVGGGRPQVAREYPQMSVYSPRGRG